MEKQLILELAASVAGNYLSRNECRIDQIGAVIHATFEALSNAVEPPPAETVYEPAVSIRSSVKPHALISLIDGQPYKMLKRHLSNHGLTPTEYRARYGLPADYPMVAPDYSERRRVLAKQIGLGRHPQAGRGRKPAARAGARKATK